MVFRYADSVRGEHCTWGATAYRNSSKPCLEAAVYYEEAWVQISWDHDDSDSTAWCSSGGTFPPQAFEGAFLRCGSKGNILEPSAHVEEFSEGHPPYYIKCDFAN